MRRTWWKSGQFNALCDVCGFKFKSVDLRQRWDGLMVCQKDWEVRHPQELIRPVQDQNKLPWTRPEPNDTYVGYGIEINPNPQIEFPPIIMETPGTIEPPGSPPVYPEGPMRVPVVLPPTFTGGTIRPDPLWPPWTIFKPIIDTPIPPYIDPGGYTLDPPGGLYPMPTLEFAVQPSNANFNSTILPPIVVWVVGNLGIPVDNYAGPVTVSIANNPGTPSPGTLSGTLTVNAVNGVATFSDLSISSRGTGYTLKASSPNLQDVYSTSFDISGIKATGGVITTSGLYTIHTFRTNGTFTTLIDNLIVDYLLAGGVGGDLAEGGGGGGEVSYVTSHNMGIAAAHTVTIGLEGDLQANGGSTTFITTAIGGGYGGAEPPDFDTGGVGACGGGGGFPTLPAPPNPPDPSTIAGGAGTVGNAGGNGYGNVWSLTYAAGGGGGMGSVGGNGAAGVGGNGGNGIQNSISGSAVYYGGGKEGGGSSSAGTRGLGYSNGNPINVGNGVVIVRYLA